MVVPNHTQIPNEFLDEKVADLSGSAVKCFIIICRKTIGWHKTSDSISYSQLMEKTGLESQAVHSALEELENAGLVVVHSCPGKANRIDINFTSSEIKEVKDDTSLKIKEHLFENQRGTSLKIKETKETIKETLVNKTTRAVARVDRDQFEQSLERAFVSRFGSFSNYGRERSNLKRLVKMMRAKAPEGAEKEFASRFLSHMWELIKQGKSWWKDAPFTPSTAVSRFDHITSGLMDSQPDPEEEALIAKLNAR